MTRTPHLADQALVDLARGRTPTPVAGRHVQDCPGCRGLVALLAAERRRPGPGPCPPAESLVLHAGRSRSRDRSLDGHLSACLECARLVEGLAALPPLPAPPPVAAPQLSLLARLRALVCFSPPEYVAVTPRGVRASAGDAIWQAAMDCYRRRRYREAARKLRSAPAGPEASFFLGACCLEAGDGAGAVDALRDAVRGRPGLGEYRWYLAQALLLVGQGREAERELGRAAARPGAYTEPARELRATLRRTLAGASPR